MKKGVWCRWQLLCGAFLALVCLSCRPAMGPAPRQAPPPPPSVRPEAAPQRPIMYVRVGRLNLRAGPGMDFPKLGLLERNEEVEKLGEAENWYQVRVRRDGTLGWVSSEYLSSTPVTAPLETPVPETPVVAPTVKEKETPPPAEPRKPKPAKVEPPAPREPKPAEAPEAPVRKPKPPAEATEPPVRKPKPAAEAAEPTAPKAPQEKPAPKREEPPPPTPPPPPPPPEEKPSGVRIM
jgi:uncharacterized protein YraI